MANPIGVTRMSDRSVHLDRNSSRYEGHIGAEIRDVRSMLSSVTDVWGGRSKAVTEDQPGLSELDRRKTNQLQDGLHISWTTWRKNVQD